MSTLICCTVLPPVLQMQCGCSFTPTSENSSNEVSRWSAGLACVYAYVAFERLAVQIKAGLRQFRSGCELAEVPL